ncbi:unnamed protein product [Pieris brassicae]|uniref:Uncharacterized protein n=1 Tax=Pieris brassicae TaxID=7116 RepID=A0A9P0XCD6_PIEBR|nr:unnamed protein product [Pieris brassicae]
MFVLCDSVLNTSFWAPLFNPRILNYRVDLNYDPNGGKNTKEEFTRKHGYRGEKLIEDLGNGKGPSENDQNISEDVKFYYTHPGARNL